MIVSIHPSVLSGTIVAPPSKSYMQRACAAALVFKGETVIENPGFSMDDKAALALIQSLGAKVQPEAGRKRIISSGIHPVSSKVNCGESGLSARMFTPIIALAERQITLEGKGSLLQRPMQFFEDVLPMLGVRILSRHGKLPLIIEGPLEARDLVIDGSLSSQFLTGLLMAFASAAKEEVHITVSNLTSRPYIDMTLEILRDFGFKASHDNYNVFTVNPSKPSGIKYYKVEGDWSGAAFILVAGAIAGNISVTGLKPSSLQADRAILDVLKNAGCDIELTDAGISVSNKNKPTPFEFNAVDCPDLFPPLVALAAYCNGTCKIYGAKRLTHKESNRAESLQQEFGKMGLKIEYDDDCMMIHGEGKLSGAKVNSHHDHRIAMACAVAALAAEGETIISDAEAIEKSYGGFFFHLKSLHSGVEIQK